MKVLFLYCFSHLIEGEKEECLAEQVDLCEISLVTGEECNASEAKTKTNDRIHYLLLGRDHSLDTVNMV